MTHRPSDDAAVSLKGRIRRPILLIFGVFALCAALRAFEYGVLRTDETPVAEAIVHKLGGIVLLAVVLAWLGLAWQSVGFARRGAIRFTLYGLALGAGTFLIAYGAELVIQASRGSPVRFELYVDGFDLAGRPVAQTGLAFFALCIVGNIVNVVMEEGVFRGLFIRLAELRMRFLSAALLSSALFGVWHVAMPVRAFLDGESSAQGAAMTALLLVVTSAVAGFKFALLLKITGSLWMPMADHFVNNAVVNTVHVVAVGSVDELQIVRIAIAQTVSFVVVVVLFFTTRAAGKPTFRP